MAMKVAAGTDVSANGEIKVDRFAFGGQMLSGDTFKTNAAAHPARCHQRGRRMARRSRPAKGTGVYFDQGSVVVSARRAAGCDPERRGSEGAWRGWYPRSST
jgi:hypothetical protein